MFRLRISIPSKVLFRESLAHLAILVAAISIAIWIAKMTIVPMQSCQPLWCYGETAARHWQSVTIYWCATISSGLGVAAVLYLWWRKLTESWIASICVMIATRLIVSCLTVIIGATFLPLTF